MTPAAFVERFMGMDGPRYRRWSSSWEFCDCFGAIALYWREVVGVELLPAPPECSMADGFTAIGSAWRECGPLPGACGFMAWDAGLPRHCGVLLPGGDLLHTEGPSPGGAGGPRVTRLAAMARLYPDLRFYAPTPKAVAP